MQLIYLLIVKPLRLHIHWLVGDCSLIINGWFFGAISGFFMHLFISPYTFSGCRLKEFPSWIKATRMEVRWRCASYSAFIIPSPPHFLGLYMKASGVFRGIRIFFTALLTILSTAWRRDDGNVLIAAICEGNIINGHNHWFSRLNFWFPCSLS